jgi:hypothetical protein
MVELVRSCDRAITPVETHALNRSPGRGNSNFSYAFSE